MDIYVALVVATGILVMIPGPNVALIVAMSIGRGTRYGLLAVAGTTLGLAGQLAFTITGLSMLIELAANTLDWLRWAGVAYLFYLGVHAWNERAGDLSQVDAMDNSGGAIFWSGVGVALVNPKTLMFNSAFLPQFISTGTNVGVTTQFIVVSTIFLGVLALGDCTWAILSGHVRHFLVRYGSLRNKITSVFLIGASAALALSRR